MKDPIFYDATLHFIIHLHTSLYRTGFEDVLDLANASKKDTSYKRKYPMI